MGKGKFRYNPHTLTFEPIQIPFVKKLANVAIPFGFSLVMAVIVYSVYTIFFDTPKEKILNRENAELAVKFDLLSKMLNETSETLAEIQRRDNFTYRAIFEADTIPSILRQGGIGGSNRYDDLKQFSNASSIIDVASKIDQLTWQTYMQSKSFDDVIEMAKNKEQLILSIPAICPVSNKHLTRISSPFGYRADPFTRLRSFHYGIDLSGPTGAPIYAAGKGKVITVQYSFVGYGRMVLIDHGFGYKSRYAHLNTIEVNEGDEVVRGQVIGTMGSTGRSTGPHLHYEVFLNNLKINPINFFGEMSGDTYDQMVKSVQAPS